MKEMLAKRRKMLVFRGGLWYTSNVWFSACAQLAQQVDLIREDHERRV